MSQVPQSLETDQDGINLPPERVSHPATGKPTLVTPPKYPPLPSRPKLSSRKQDPKDPCSRALEVKPSNNLLPFVPDAIRVGIGGAMLVVEMATSEDESPYVEFNNIEDGEVLKIRALRILESDCKNIVIMR